MVIIIKAGVRRYAGKIYSLEHSADELFALYTEANSDSDSQSMTTFNLRRAEPLYTIIVVVGFDVIGSLRVQFPSNATLPVTRYRVFR